MKKVDEGVELFDEIWEKVYNAEQQNQKEKHEVDLKKEIKKLQRLRDQIKTWISSSEVKDKDGLLEARKLIETKMEQFKICEKETKTKTYSKEGLARTEKLSPEEQMKEDTCKWVGETIEKLQECVDEKDVEIERLSSGKSKKSNKHVIEDYNEQISNHKYHINKLEGIMRLVMNDRLDPELVNDLREDLEYYVEAHNEEDFLQSYDQDAFYDSLGLDDMDVVNVDRVTQAPPTKSSKSDDASSASGSLDRKSKSKKGTSTAAMIPLTIGRARVTSGSSSKSNKDEPKETTTPKKLPSSNGPTPLTSPVNGVPPPSSTSALGNVPGAPPIRPQQIANPVNNGASMAAILKREGEQQAEKERQKQNAIQQAQQQRLLQEQQARAQAEQLRQQQLQRQQEQLRQQEALRLQQVAQQKSQQEALQRQQQQQQQQQQQLEQEQQQRIQQEAVAKQQQQLQAQQAAQQQQQQIRSQQQPPASSQGATLDSLLTAGLGGLSLGISESGIPSHTPPAAISPQQPSSGATVGSPISSSSYDATASYLGALDESYIHRPSNADSERQRTYTPRNPYPTPSSYPTTPAPIFENPAVFEKLGTDALFFIFYYAQGTYQQYLAARELKKQSWRYHKKYMTWFQRHEEPKVTTDEYEQGTYVYFDYETGWCQRIKSDFRFEYSFLEDSLSI
jgi:CCR4-NOT transcription complex subunit 3